MSKQARWVLAIVTMALLAIFAGCNGSGGDDLPGKPSLPGQSAVDLTNESRLSKTGNLDEYAVKGTVSVKGLTVLNSDGEPVSNAYALPELDARLLDPEEDILSTVKPGLDGKFRLVFNRPGKNNTTRVGVISNDSDKTNTESQLYTALLVVSGRVEQDLDGDGEGNDEIRQQVPLALLPGQEVDVSLELSYGEQRYVDPALLPETGWFIFAVLNAVDADGAKDETYAVFYATNTTVFDTDGDNYLEFGDYSGEDVDLNGMVDIFQDIDMVPATSVLVLEGQITAVNSANLTLMLRTFEGGLYTLQLQQFTPVELWSKYGTPIGNVPLGPQLIGMYASTEGPLSGGMVHPWQVIVYDGF